MSHWEPSLHHHTTTCTVNPHTQSLQVWAISPGLYGDLFWIRGFSPITGLISLFSRPVSSSSFCSTAVSLLPSSNLLPYSLSSAFISSRGFQCSQLPRDVSHVDDFKSSSFCAPTRRLCSSCKVTNKGKCRSTETASELLVILVCLGSTLCRVMVEQQGDGHSSSSTFSFSLTQKSQEV